MQELPPLEELLHSARVVALPMRERFRGITVREALLIEGPNGWAEFSPFVEYLPEEAAVWLASAIDWAYGPEVPALRERVPVNATLPAVDASAVPRVLDPFGAMRTVKVKVAEREQTLADDVARVRAAREWVGAGGRIRLDANGGWNVDEAEHAAHALAEFDLEYLEQPCTTVAELAELRERLHDWGIPIAADESVRKAADPLAVARAGAADILVVKAAPLGGVSAALAIAAEADLPIVVSSAIDTSVGLATGIRLAAALPELPFDCGLGTAALLAADVVAEPLMPVDGTVAVERRDVSPELLVRHAAAPDRDLWWRARLAACHAVLAARAAAPRAP